MPEAKSITKSKKEHIMKKSKIAIATAVFATVLSGAALAKSKTFDYKDLSALDQAQTPFVEVINKTEESIWSRHRRRF